MKRTLALILTLAMVLSCGVTAMAAEPAVVASPQSVVVDGETVSVTAYNIDNYNYFKLRDMAIMLNGTDSQFEVGYDEASGLISVTTYTAYTGKTELVKGEDLSSTCVASSQTLSVDGQAVTLKAYNIGGYNYFKLRDLGNELGFAVEYDVTANEMVVDSIEPLSFEKATKTDIVAHLNGEEISVTKYEAVYCATPNRVADQQLALFIPENATAESPIVYMVDNSGWRSDAYASVAETITNYGTALETDFRTGKTEEVIVGDYYSGTDTDAVGECLANGYVVMVAGARSRADGLTGDEYLGHAATMTDAKAAIRWVKANADKLPAGDADRIVITGTSGGGALSVVISASGNSSDYFESLYEIGAAGIVKNADGTYSDTLSDDIWATIAYCPITDLPNACAAYEWQWAEAREQVIADDKVPTGGFGAPVYPSEEVRAEATAVLTENYVEYLDSLGLASVSSANLEATIIKLMETEIAESIEEIGIEQMKADLGDADWLVINDDGTFTYDYEKHLYWVGTQSAFKAPSAFSNVGMSAWKGNMNEDDLFGDTCDAYSPFNEYSWNNDDTENHVGLDDTDLTWDEFLATEDGEALLDQMKRTSPIQYLLDAEGESTSAPNWYVRYGMADRDSSFAVEAVLNAAIDADETVTNKTFEYAWLKPHSGNYDVQEAYTWLEKALLEDMGIEFWDVNNFTNIDTEELSITVDGEATSVTHYNGHYYDWDEENTLTVGPGKYGPSGDRDDCQVSIYVPEDATEDSAVMFLIENGSWAQSGYKNVITDGAAFDTTTQDRVALALAHDMIVVSYGARCRGSVDKETGEIHIHAPTMIADTKAAIRFVKYNIDLGNIPGDADKVVISGHSGGGALTAIIAASGNSSDFDEYLVNAAPATDDIFATMSSAPITDLAMADQAYEWTFSDYREEAPYDSLTYGEYDEAMLALSEELAADYVTYVADMFGLTEEEYTAKITELFAASVQHELDLDEEFQYSDIRPETDERGWFELDENGDVASFDLDAYTTWAVNNAGIGAAYAGNELKGIMAFNSEGMLNGYSRNENNLWGTADQAYSVAYEELWDLVKDPAAIGVDQYASFDEFWAAEGDLLAKQFKSVSVMPYLVGTEAMWYLDGVETSEECDVAPNWFIRHGMGDIDTSYAVVASLILGVEEAAEGEVNAYFGWERGHNKGGGTYYAEFFQWMEDNGWVEEYTAPSAEEEPKEEEPKEEEPKEEEPKEEEPTTGSVAGYYVYNEVNSFGLSIAWVLTLKEDGTYILRETNVFVGDVSYFGESYTVDGDTVVCGPMGSAPAISNWAKLAGFTVKLSGESFTPIY